MKERILIIGSLNMDLVIPVKSMPVVGETILGKGLSYIPGGKGANQAAAVGRLGGDAVMLGCVGCDSFGKRQKEMLSSFGVDVSKIKSIDDQPTGTAVINVDENGNNSIVVVQGANNSCDISYLKEEEKLIQDSGYLLMQMEVPDETIFQAAARAREYGKCVILNPAPAPDSLPDSLLKGLDYITPNETELCRLTGETSEDRQAIKRGARKLISRGVKNVIVTLGGEGAFFASEKEEIWYPSRKVRPVDTTAAGDCFNGALVTALAEGRSREEAIFFATAAASVAVTRKGAQSSIPDRSETEKVLKEWQENI